MISKSAREFPARPDVPGMLKNIWFSYGLGSQRARRFFFKAQKNGCDNLRFYVFAKIDLAILTKLMVLKGFRRARGGARMWPLYCYLIGIRFMLLTVVVA